MRILTIKGPSRRGTSEIGNPGKAFAGPLLVMIYLQKVKMRGEIGKVCHIFGILAALTAAGPIILTQVIFAKPAG